MFLGWYKAGPQGANSEKPAPGYKWSQLPQLNQQIYEKHRDQPLQDVQRQFHSSCRQILKTIEGISEADLFTRARFVWTEKNALVAYIIPNTSSHYRWARAELRKGLKGKQKR